MKTLTTDQSRTPKPGVNSSLVPETWEDFSRLHPIYEALTRQCGLSTGPYPAGVSSSQWPDKKTRDRLWLDEVDQHVQAVHLRQFLATPAAAREDGLRLMLQRLLGKREKTPADRDKIDLLCVQYFVLCAPQDLIAGPVEISDAARILQPVLGELNAALHKGRDSFDRILAAAQQCQRLREFMEQGLMEQGRLVKATMGDAFYDPAELVAVCRFNFLLRRAFIRLIHTDLNAVGATLKELERRKVQVIDCRRAGLSPAESIANLRQYHEHWKPPSQTDYSRASAFRPYEQLMSLREDLEEAAGQLAAGSDRAPGSETTSDHATNHEWKAEPPGAQQLPGGSTPALISSTAPLKLPSTKSQDEPTRAAGQNSATFQPMGPADQMTPDIGVADVENLEEKIWEQLIASPPARGRSMTTVTVENTRILLSAWEVAAFISDSSKDSVELRRVIVARALLSAAIDRRKRLMDFKVLRQALAHARGEVPRFQECVDQFKRNSKTDGAVNLGISLKRLLSLIEEAEQLQKGNGP